MDNHTFPLFGMGHQFLPGNRYSDVFGFLKKSVNDREEQLS